MHTMQIHLPRSSFKVRLKGEGLDFSYSQPPLCVWGQSLGTKVVRRSSQRGFRSSVWFTCDSQQNAMEKIKFSCSWPLSSGLIHKTNCIGSITLLGVILPYTYMLQAMCNRMDHTLKVRGTAARVSKDGSIFQTGCAGMSQIRHQKGDAWKEHKSDLTTIRNSVL